MRSLGTGKVIPKTCKSYLCADCAGYLRKRWGVFLHVGLLIERPGRVPVLLTLTDGAAGALKMAGLYAAWERFKAAAKRRGWLDDAYAVAVERQERGALHLHVLTWWPADRAHLVPGPAQRQTNGKVKRTREQYALHFGELVPAVKRAGFGPMVDIELVQDARRAAWYASKAVAGYATKAAADALREEGVQRVRPVRTSRSWVPGMTFESFEPEKKDPGPWQDVTTTCGGSGVGPGRLGPAAPGHEGLKWSPEEVARGEEWAKLWAWAKTSGMTWREFERWRRGA